MNTKHLLAVVGLLAGACQPDRPRPEAHAQQVAMAKLGIHAPSSVIPGSVWAERISADTVAYYMNPAIAGAGGYLVRYRVRTQGKPDSNEVAYVTGADSVYSLYPFRHVAEFNQKYGTRY